MADRRRVDVGKGKRLRAARRAAQDWVDGDPQGTPTQCTRCGTVYDVGISVTPETNATLGVIRFRIQNSLRPCPKCGTYNLPTEPTVSEWAMVEEGARLAARLPREQQEQLLADLLAVQRGDETLEALAEERAASPTAALWTWLQSRENMRDVALWLGVLIAVLVPILQAISADPDLSPDQVEQIIERVVEETRDEAPPTSPAPASSEPPAAPAQDPAPMPPAPAGPAPPGS